MRLSWRVLLGSVVGLGTVLPAQPVVPLGKPLYQTSADFTDVSAVRLLGDGTMLVADPGAREFVRVTARGTSRAVVGRHGSGPGEYESAQQLLGLPDGQVVLIDPPQNRWLAFDSLGAFRRIKPFGPTERMLRYPDFIDALGNVYGLGFPDPPPAKPMRALLRWNAASGRIDTLASVAGADMIASPMPADAKGRPAGIAYFFVPYAAQDAWAALRDGSLVIARANGERLEWRDATGRVTDTSALPPVPRVPVSDSARAAETRAAMRDRIPRTQPIWADATLLANDDGTVWMRRTRSPEETFTEFLEFEKGRGVTRRVRVTGRARVVGVRGDLMVLARRTEDDLQQLEVYRVPRRAAAASK